jgi:hypothetical protein
VPELPPFLRPLRRSRFTLPRGERAIPKDIAALYDEWAACSDTDGWISSPRGRWVDFQIDWYEQRRELFE